jgi:hypothetical protein
MDAIGVVEPILKGEPIGSAAIAGVSPALINVVTRSASAEGGNPDFITNSRSVPSSSLTAISTSSRDNRVHPLQGTRPDARQHVLRPAGKD